MTDATPSKHPSLVVNRVSERVETFVADARCAVDATGHLGEFDMDVYGVRQRRGIVARPVAGLVEAPRLKDVVRMWGEVL